MYLYFLLIYKLFYIIHTKEKTWSLFVKMNFICFAAKDNKIMPNFFFKDEKMTKQNVTVKYNSRSPPV